MTIMISISCDNCDEYAETSASIESGVNEIEAALEEGWVHEGGTNYCPECAPLAEGETL